MFDLIRSFLGWQEKPSPPNPPDPVPPPVTIIGVRIPADGSPIHLLSLTTTPASGAADTFLFHVPDLRPYWKTEQAWRYRDLQRLEVQEQPRESCNGVYYIFFSFAYDDLPENKSVPAWLVTAFSFRRVFWGDVFVVKMAPHEFGLHAWAAYEDVAPDFLDMLVKGPSGGRRGGFRSLYQRI